MWPSVSAPDTCRRLGSVPRARPGRRRVTSSPRPDSDRGGPRRRRRGFRSCGLCSASHLSVFPPRTRRGAGAGGPGTGTVRVCPSCLSCHHAVSDRPIPGSSVCFHLEPPPGCRAPPCLRGQHPEPPWAWTSEGRRSRLTSTQARLPLPLSFPSHRGVAGMGREASGLASASVPGTPPCAVSLPGGTSLGPGVTAVICSQVSWPGMTTASAAWG